jgi:hypothetical protein
MSCVAAPSGLDERLPAPIAPRCPRPSGRKNAHRGLAACRRPASGKTCSQALIASGKTPRLPTTARRSHLLQQSDPSQSNYPTVTVPGLSVTVSSTSENDTSDSSTSGYDGIVDTVQTLPQIVVTAYNGKFHDQLVNDLASGMNASGWHVMTEMPLCLENGVCARADIFGTNPAGQLTVLEVKTGQNPSFTPNQLAVYPHLSAGGLVMSPSLQISQFGFVPGAPLPPIVGGLLYQANATSPPYYVPFPEP